MTKRLCLTQLALSALLIAGVAAEAAAIQRTFVASYGIDAGSCGITSPCRTFGFAMTQTSSNGEVIVLDSAGYGGVTIAQSVSIIAPPGVYAGISVFSGVGMTISAGSGKVTLRGLTINQQGGTTGIQVNSANTVYIDRVTISGFANGLVVSTAAPTTINILQSAFRDNTGSGATFTNSSGTLAVSIAGSVFERNNTSGASFANNTAGAIVSSLIAGGGSGIVLNPTSGTSKIEVRDSNINDNASNGVYAFGTAPGTATASVVSSIVSGNGNGLLAQNSGSQIYVSDSTITRNTTGVVTISSGTVVSGTDNRLVNNNTDGAFSSTVGKI